MSVVEARTDIPFQRGHFRFLTPSGPAPTLPVRLFSAPLLGQALGARLLLVG
jgi:hypothetical protein